MHSISKWQKIIFQTSQFNHFAFCRKSMTSSGHDIVKVFFFTRPPNPIWVWVQRIPSFFLYYCKQKFYNHFCKAWGFMLQNLGNMPWWYTVNTLLLLGRVHCLIDGANIDVVMFDIHNNETAGQCHNECCTEYQNGEPRHHWTMAWQLTLLHSLELLVLLQNKSREWSGGSGTSLLQFKLQ